MNFTAQEIARFDHCLFNASCWELFGFFLLETFLLIFVLLLIFLPDKYLYEKRHSNLREKPKKSRYCNGKKLSRREFDEERQKNRQKRKRRNKIFRICAVTFLIFFGMIVIFVANKRSSNLRLDMEQDAYMSYEGAFACEYHHSKNGIYYTFTFTNAEGKTVTLQGDDSDFYGMKEGNYYGHLVYGQNSEYLIEMEITE